MDIIKNYPATVKGWQTSDGRVHADEAEAVVHQKALDLDANVNAIIQESDVPGESNREMVRDVIMEMKSELYGVLREYFSEAKK